MSLNLRFQISSFFLITLNQQDKLILSIQLSIIMSTEILLQKGEQLLSMYFSLIIMPIFWQDIHNLMFQLLWDKKPKKQSISLKFINMLMEKALRLEKFQLRLYILLVTHIKVHVLSYLMLMEKSLVCSQVILYFQVKQEDLIQQFQTNSVLKTQLENYLIQFKK